ncbi:MAG: hypothetical protein WC637_07005, partial [Victivallales bacterium]
MPARFENLDLGTILRMQCSVKLKAPLRFPTFVTVRFEREDWLLLPKHKPYPLSFSMPAEKRELHTRCETWEGTGLPLMRLIPTISANNLPEAYPDQEDNTDTRTDSDGNNTYNIEEECWLDAMFPALTGELNGSVPI